MKFELVSPISDIEVIARGHGIRVKSTLRKKYGAGRWRKIKGVASVRLASGKIVRAELHWYEAHGIGKRDLRIKRTLESD